jgi:hypothetical protein
MLLRPVVAFALVALAAAPTAASSAPVAHDRFHDQFTAVDSATCAFPITVHSEADLDDALFFDADGNLVRVLETVQHARITFSANGKTLEALGSGGIEIVFNPDGSTTASTFGIDLKLTLPGEGAVLLDTGRAAFLFDPHIHVLFEAGPQVYDTDAFCAALSA